MRITYTTNINTPKYYIKWVERSPRGVISSYTRVFAMEVNMNAFYIHLTQDPVVQSLVCGEGRPNQANTSMKAITTNTWENTDGIHDDASGGEAGDD